MCIRDRVSTQSTGIPGPPMDARLMELICAEEEVRVQGMVEQAETVRNQSDAEAIEEWGSVQDRDSMASMYQDDADDSRSVLSLFREQDWSEAYACWGNMDTAPRDSFSCGLLTVLFAREGSDPQNGGNCPELKHASVEAILLKGIQPVSYTHLTLPTKRIV
eukprot:TRINITY_DN29791_c0_g1_i2.p1 TRINITY_DN29791_c0_g1~~TRINITY_DN29791_c0_g1_i2.p1  ORF type:complete len:162 (+),score=36.07 TRINITY_DN29791_c0_g1_i2:87-572(+)